MKTVLKLTSFIGLLLTVAPAFLVFAGTISLGEHKTLMLIGACTWFLTAPFWMNKAER
jgi:hypothetical protein